MTSIKSTSEVVQQIITNSNYVPTRDEINALSVDGFDPADVGEHYQLVHDRLTDAGLDAARVQKFDSAWSRWAGDVVAGGLYDTWMYTPDQRAQMAATLGNVDGTGLATSALMSAVSDNISYAPNLADAAIVALGDQQEAASESVDVLMSVLKNQQASGDMIQHAMIALGSVGGDSIKSLPLLAQYIGVNGWTEKALDAMAFVFDSYVAGESAQGTKNFSGNDLDRIFKGMSADQVNSFSLHYLAMVHKEEIPDRHMGYHDGGSYTSLNMELESRVTYFGCDETDLNTDCRTEMAMDSTQPTSTRRDALTVAGNDFYTYPDLLTQLSEASVDANSPLSVRAEAAKGIVGKMSIFDGYLTDSGEHAFPQDDLRQISEDMFANIQTNHTGLVAYSTQVLVAAGNAEWALEILKTSTNANQQYAICLGLHNQGYYDSSQLYSSRDPQNLVTTTLLQLITPNADGTEKLSSSLLAGVHTMLGTKG